MESTSFARLIMFGSVFVLIFLAIFLYSKYEEKIPKANVSISKIIADGNQQESQEDIEPAHQAIPMFITAGITFIVVILVYGMLKTIGSRHKKP